MIQFFSSPAPCRDSFRHRIFHVSRKDKEERLLFQEGTVKYRPFASTLLTLRTDHGSRSIIITRPARTII